MASPSALTTRAGRPRRPCPGPHALEDSTCHIHTHIITCTQIHVHRHTQRHVDTHGHVHTCMHAHWQRNTQTHILNVWKAQECLCTLASTQPWGRTSPAPSLLLTSSIVQAPASILCLWAVQ